MQQLKGAGRDDPQRSLPTPTILCDSVWTWEVGNDQGRCCSAALSSVAPVVFPDAAEGASSSSTDTSAESEAVSCALRCAGLQKCFIRSILSEFQAAVKVFVWA